MVQFGRKKKLTDYIYTRPTILVLLVILFLLSISVYDRYTIEREMAERRSKVESEQVDLIDRKEDIQAKVDYLSGERGIEEEVRKNFDVAKEGEQVIILLGEEDEDNEFEVEEEKSTKWYRFWR